MLPTPQVSPFSLKNGFNLSAITAVLLGMSAPLEINLFWNLIYCGGEKQFLGENVKAIIYLAGRKEGFGM
jgi:hypothetical protein